MTSILIGGAPTARVVMDFLRETFSNVRVIESYGTMEVGSIAVNGRILPSVGIKFFHIHVCYY